ncbi:inner centromere protein isoform X2 [Phascolarctos cinereus]|uniref:Inner centromere protein isoform X2 n=1 Tax=Phascolarctos cinereus TaxID=38626 RepID=A0A6P5IY00_PHACI|nr:inner centromere protein isoform X2 [Phascolarctos cinereus]
MPGQTCGGGRTGRGGGLREETPAPPRPGFLHPVPASGTMGTTMGSASILEVCNTKLAEFMRNVDNKDMVWLQEIKEEALKMFSSDFSVEPELMPKTPSQRNRRRKKRFSSIQDENRPPTRNRLSRRTSRRSSQHGRQLLRSKDRLEKLVLVATENGSIPRGTRSQAAAGALPPESPTVLPPKPRNLPSVGKLMPVVEISASEQRSAEKCLVASKARPADEKLSFVLTLGCEAESTPKEQAESLPRPAPDTSIVVPAEVPEVKATRLARSVAKLHIARLASPEDAVPVMTEPDGVPSSPGTQPQPETELLLNLPESPRTPTGSRRDRRSVRRSLVRKSLQAHRVSLLHKYSMVPKRISSTRRSSRKLAQEPAATGRIICHSYLERLLDVEVPRKASSEEDLEHTTETEQEATEGTRRTLRPRNAHKIAISTPKTQPESGSRADGNGESKTDQSEEPSEPPQSVRRKRSYKQAVSELDENGDHMDDEALTPPRTKTPSPICPPSKVRQVVRPLRTFLHTVQKNQMLMTPTSAGRTGVMKSFIKRNTPQHMDAKGSFVEKERQRLENLKKKEEAELLRKQKVEEDKRRRLEEVKMKREERLRKVLQARERAEQLEVEKKKRIEQKLAQLEKNEKAKEERLAEEKARKKAAKKLEEAEAKRRQEEEARRQKKLQQEEEERRYQEQLQKKKEEEQERLRKVAEARRIVEQQKQREQQLALEREMERKKEQERLQAERERALRLQKERLQRELEEKRKREEGQRQEQERKKLQEEQERKAREAATGATNKFLNVTVDVQSPVCNSYEMTPQGPKAGPKINPDNYGMDLNSDDSTDDETQPRKPIPAWANGTQLSQAVIRQYYQPPDVDQLFGAILSPKLEDIFNKSKPRYHKRTSSAVWHSPPLPGSRAPVGLPYGLKKP